LFPGALFLGVKGRKKNEGGRGGDIKQTPPSTIPTKNWKTRNGTLDKVLPTGKKGAERHRNKKKGQHKEIMGRLGEVISDGKRVDGW